MLKSRFAGRALSYWYSQKEEASYYPDLGQHILVWQSCYLGRWYIIPLLSSCPEFIIAAETEWEIQKKIWWKASINSGKEVLENTRGTSLKKAS